jgi:hypothetical protein
MAKAAEPIAMDIVERRIIRALKTIRVLPDKEARFLTYIGTWPDYVLDYYEEERKRFKPTPADVGDCLDALDWLRGMQNRDIKFVYWRSYEFSFRQIGDKIGTSDETARTRYRDAMIRVWANANGYSQDNFGKLKANARKLRESEQKQKKVA